MKKANTPKTVEIVDSDYQPTKAEMEEEFALRSDGSVDLNDLDEVMSELGKAMTQRVNFRRIKKPGFLRCRRFVLGLLLFSLVVTAACAARRAPYVGARDQVRGYRLNGVRVSFADEIDMGVFARADGEDDAAFVRRVAGSIEESIRNHTRLSLAGSEPADISVTLDRITVASDIGRATGGDSQVSGMVEVIDVSSSRVIARNYVTGMDAASDSWLPYVSEVRNIVSATRDDEVERVTERFVASLKFWLEH